MWACSQYTMHSTFKYKIKIIYEMQWGIRSIYRCHRCRGCFFFFIFLLSPSPWQCLQMTSSTKMNHRHDTWIQSLHIRVIFCTFCNKPDDDDADKRNGEILGEFIRWEFITKTNTQSTPFKRTSCLPYAPHHKNEWMYCMNPSLFCEMAIIIHNSVVLYKPLIFLAA